MLGGCYNASAPAGYTLTKSNSAFQEFAPCARGYTVRIVWATVALDYPAHAGVYPTREHKLDNLRRLPRARGGIPTPQQWGKPSYLFAPPTRGYARVGGHSIGRTIVCPAHAGVYRSLG